MWEVVGRFCGFCGLCGLCGAVESMWEKRLQSFVSSGNLELKFRLAPLYIYIYYILSKSLNPVVMVPITRFGSKADARKEMPSGEMLNKGCVSHLPQTLVLT